MQIAAIFLIKFLIEIHKNASFRNFSNKNLRQFAKMQTSTVLQIKICGSLKKSKQSQFFQIKSYSDLINANRHNSLNKNKQKICRNLQKRQFSEIIECRSKLILA